MTGSRTSVLGVKPEQALESLITQMPVRFETAEEDVWVMGAVVEVNDEGCDSIEREPAIEQVGWMLRLLTAARRLRPSFEGSPPQRREATSSSG